MSTSETILRYISAELLLGQENLDLDASDNILTTGLIDSLGIMRLIAFLEEEYELHVPPEDVTIEHFRTVQKIADYLEARRAVPA